MHPRFSTSKTDTFEYRVGMGEMAHVLCYIEHLPKTPRHGPWGESSMVVFTMEGKIDLFHSTFVHATVMYLICPYGCMPCTSRRQ